MMTLPLATRGAPVIVYGRPWSMTVSFSQTFSPLAASSAISRPSNEPT
jgi:hypothetical protein